MTTEAVSRPEPTTSLLEIRIHLEDGRVAVFHQEDAQKAQRLLDHIQPGKLFAPPILGLGSATKMTAFQSRLVTRVDVIATTLPAWPFYGGVVDLQEITRENFENETRADRSQEPSVEEAARLQIPIQVYSELEMVSGERIFLRVCLKLQQRLPLEQGLFMQHLFASTGLYARRLGGGMVIVNPANVVRMALYPGSPTLPPGVWDAEHISG